MKAVIYARYSSENQREEYLSLSISQKIKPTHGLGDAYT
jgi:DNA invertase Pin-like site-specific DNA recombinase